MKFEANWRCYSTRYWGGIIGLGMMLLFAVLRPISDDKLTTELLLHTMFFRDKKITLLLVGICIYGQVVLYFSSGSSAKLIIIDENTVTFHLFNKKTHEFKYSDLSSLEYTNDIYKIFLFTFKDGRKQKISNSVKNLELAFEMIRQKIQESNK